ncbi:Reverse_transcriptase (RNA-dependent DNA polymerase) [Hexamita inflata]|uniref:Reverse transcriptase (RNA-dependent DNA polymerase) n=1 Tax=Hexamita inflata TaxID=28002 RepID=A0AA86UMQ8_9EUKA|nr:Reverse transcriptase (RNA-dependent DNA polymerase) [Hexamita inflata]
MAEYERLKLEVNTNKTSSNDKTLFENKSGIVTYLGQEFGQDAKPLTDQILANVQERIGSLFDLDISSHNRYTLYEKCILTCANYGPLVDVCDDTQENTKKYLQIDDELIKGLRKIIEVNVPKEELMRFALSHKCKGGAHQIYTIYTIYTIYVNISRTTLQPHETRPVRERTTNCKKAQEYHIGVHDKIVDHIEQLMQFYYRCIYYLKMTNQLDKYKYLLDQYLQLILTQLSFIIFIYSFIILILVLKQQYFLTFFGILE